MIFILFSLTKILSQPPNPNQRQQSLELNKIDLVAYARMLGGINAIPLAPGNLSANFLQELGSVELMIANRELRDAIAQLSKMKRRRTPLEQAVIEGYIGVCYNELIHPGATLNAFQAGLKLIDTATTEIGNRLLGWLAFNTGYLFQYYSLPESAVKYYQRSRTAISNILTDPPAFAGTLFNNLGVAAEMTGDTVGAKAAYLVATAYIDTTAPDRAGKRLRENLRRIEKGQIKPPPAGQHQSSP